jgi:tripartite-type tricarboxylate transporter receptor subunit TctC
MNKVGGYGSTALQAAVGAPADGHTLVVSIASSFVVWPEIQKMAAIALEQEIVPIGVIGVQPMVISVNRSVGANTLAELFEITQQRPDEILYGGGRATIPHLTGVRLASSGAVKWRFIPSQGPRAVQDAMGGSIHVVIESAAALASPMGAGLLKGLAVASASRLPDLPDLPTIGEAIPELGNFEALGWVTLMARAGTPEAIIQKINRDLRNIMVDVEVVRRLSTLGTYPRLLSPAETAAFIASEKEVWRPIVRSLDLTDQ